MSRPILVPSVCVGSLLLLHIILALAAVPAVARPHQARELVFDPARVEFIPDGDAVAVRYPGAIDYVRPGAPQLPTMIVWAEIPNGTRLEQVAIEVVETISLGAVRVSPAPLPRTTVSMPVPARRDPAIYERDAFVPTDWVEAGISASLRGRRLAVVHVHPLRWNPQSGELRLITRLRYTIEVSADPAGFVLPRHRIVPSIERRFDSALRSRIGNLGPNPVTAMAMVGDGPAGPGPFQPTFRPTPDGSPVEYVLVTSDALAAEFERLTEWKTRKGVRAVVRTVEWIDDTYPNGADRAERIRFFVRDAYQNWGTLFVALGGDTDVIPARFAEAALPTDERIPCDMYYGCLEGNWNFDGDDRFGEGISSSNPAPADSVDLFFEVSVGRLPVSTVQEAHDYVGKLLTYEIDAPTDHAYPASLLALAEVLFSTLHGATIAEEALAFLPPWFKTTRLYEDAVGFPGSYELTREAAIDSLNLGYGMVLHIGHGYRNTMSVGPGTLNNADINHLTNSPRNSVALAINCSSASIDFNAIGERWLKSQDGGSIAYLGTSRQAYVGPARTYMLEWFELAFADSMATGSVGLVTDLARVVMTPWARSDGTWRWTLLATLLLGDPEFDLYLNEIAPLAVAHQPDYEFGEVDWPVSVTSGGEPVAGALVTLEQVGEAFARDTTDAMGNARLMLHSAATGAATLTVHRSYYRVYQATVAVVATTAPYLHRLGTLIDDDTAGASSGDDDGLADAGETIELGLTIRNAGGTVATNVAGVITIVDPEGVVSVLEDTVTYGTMNAGGASSGTGFYVLEIAAGAPVAYQPVIELRLTAAEGSWEDVTTLPIHRPHLLHHVHAVDDALPRGNGNGVIEPGEWIWYTIDLMNAGQDGLTDVQAALRVLGPDLQPHPLVTVHAATALFGAVPAGEIVSGSRFEFELDSAVEPDEMLLEVTYTQPPHDDIVQLLDVIGPGVPDSVRAFGSPSSITLKWDAPVDADVAGYDVWRSDAPLGPYERLNAFTVAGVAVYEDGDLPPLTRYYYKVVSRDSSYNAGPHSAVISGTTNPELHVGWPNELGQQSTVSPTIVDLDGDFRMEILSAAEMQYAWHSDGTEVLDGDDDPRTNGPFSLYGRHATRGFGATQAVGDIDGDGDMEIANVTFSRDSLLVWDHLGQLVPGFPKDLLHDYNWGSPVMADLDLDGDLEIIVWAGKGGRLFAWHHDGVEVVDGDNDPATDGLMTGRIYSTSFNYGSPVVANLDADPEFEVIVTVNLSTEELGGVYAFNIDGTAVEGWPVFTGEPGIPSEVSSSPVVGDLDRDGDVEIVVAAERQGGRIFVYHHDGSLDPNWPVAVAAITPYSRLPSPALADLDGDTYLDIVFPSTTGELWAWDRFGNPLDDFPVSFADLLVQATECTPTIGDIDGDGLMEILFGDESGKLHGFNHDGTELDGFPIQTNGEVRGSAAIWDLDEDNQVEIAVTSYDGNVYVWDLPFEFRPGLVPWPFFRHDTRNSGYVETPILPVGVVHPAAAPARVATRPVLHPAVPNPFNPRTRIAFDVPGESAAARHVRLVIYDVSGRFVRALVDGPVGTGQQAVVWDGRTAAGGAAASGVYFAELRIGRQAATRKLILLE